MSLVIDHIETVEQVVELANEIERAEAAVKAMKEELRRFVDENGAVETADKRWDFSISTSWRFEPDQLKDMAQAIALEGKNPWELLTLSLTSLRKLGWGEDILSQYGTKRETRRFTSRKK